MSLQNLTPEEIERIVETFKAIAEPARIRILALLTQRPHSGKELAEAMGLSPSTIAHHMAILKRSGLVRVQREDASHIYELQLSPLFEASQKLLGGQRFGAKEGPYAEEASESPSDKVLSAYFENGHLKAIPAQLKKRLIVLEKLAEEFERGRTYTEKEVNEILKGFHPDCATLRRELVNYKFLARDNKTGTYWVPDKEHE